MIPPTSWQHQQLFTIHCHRDLTRHPDQILLSSSYIQTADCINQLILTGYLWCTWLIHSCLSIRNHESQWDSRHPDCYESADFDGARSQFTPVCLSGFVRLRCIRPVHEIFEFNSWHVSFLKTFRAFYELRKMWQPTDHSSLPEIMTRNDINWFYLRSCCPIEWFGDVISYGAVTFMWMFPK